MVGAYYINRTVLLTSAVSNRRLVYKPPLNFLRNATKCQANFIISYCIAPSFVIVLPQFYRSLAAYAAMSAVSILLK